MGYGISDTFSRKNGEFPIRTERIIYPFMFAKYLVTNGDFENFIKSTNYTNLRSKIAGFSYKFLSSVNQSLDKVVPSRKLKCEPWLYPIHNTHWDSDKNSSVYWKKLPVTHVDLDDALSFCEWLHPSGRLPTEFEWEFAARNGAKDSRVYPWGNGFRRKRINSWQGIFPTENQLQDGFSKKNPTNSFPAQTNSGIHDLLGNVWEWTVTSYKNTNLKPHKQGCDLLHAKWKNANKSNLYVLKGGSYIESQDGSGTGYPLRVSSRTTRPHDFTAEIIGFRCVIQLDKKTKDKGRPRKTFLEALNKQKFKIPHDEF